MSQSEYSKTAKQKQQEERKIANERVLSSLRKGTKSSTNTSSVFNPWAVHGGADSTVKPECRILEFRSKREDT